MKGEGMTEIDQKKEEFRQRTKRFASETIRLYCSLPKNRLECQVVGRQLLRSGTAVAAIYREASRARSDAEFVSKIDQSAQEADETMLWLELLEEDCGIVSERLTWLHREADELIAILVTMSRKVKRRMAM